MSLDNTGNPVPELSTLTLRLTQNSPDRHCCFVGLALGEIEIRVRNDLEIAVGLKSATLKITHAGFDIIEQRFLKRHDMNAEGSDPNAVQIKTTTTDKIEASGDLKLNELGMPSGRATGSISHERTIERKMTERGKSAVSSVEGKAGPIWVVKSHREETPLDGEYISFSQPLMTLLLQPGKNYLETRGTLHVRQQDLLFRRLSKTTKLDRNKDAVIGILIAKGISKVTNEYGEYRGEIILSDQTDTLMAPR